MDQSAVETEAFEGAESPRVPRWLAGNVTEQLDPEILRLVGHVRQWAALGFIIITTVTAIFAREVGLRVPFYWYYAALDNVLLVVAGLCGRALWRRSLSIQQMARLNTVCLALECFSILLEVWVNGSVSAPMLGVAALWVVMYRLTLDTRSGLRALGAMLGGHWGMVLCEALHVIPSHPGLEVNPVPVGLARTAAALAPFTLMLFAGFFLAHWTKLRLVDRERTLRVLRRALASGPGEIGPETGRLLAGVYAVGARLGRGGMGEVYEATDTRSGERVAVKMLHLHLANQARSLRRFTREAAILRDLGSPHIVRSLALEQDEGRPFIVLELLVGETLAQRVERTGGLSLTEVAAVARQLGAALEVAHQHGVVHRDLSPANVFLCSPEPELQLKVLDFGISKIESATGMTQEGALLGTPAFMAPEQVEGRVDGVTPLTDIYAMGLVLFVALTGRMPFESDSGQLASVTSLRPELGPEVDSVLRHATARDAAARFSSAAELATALVAALSIRR